MPRVSVILVHYETPRFLQGAISSVLSQTYRDFELHVIDDGSTDPTVAPILDGLGGIANVRVHRCETTNEDRLASCRYATLINWACFGHTAGELVTFLMGDDAYYPDRLERMVTALDTASAEVVYGAQSLCDQHGVEFDIRPAQAPLHDAFERVDLNSVLMKKSAFLEVRGFDEGPEWWRNADAQLFRKLNAAGKVFYPVLGAPTDRKHFRPDSVTENVLKNLPPWHSDPLATTVDHVPIGRRYEAGA